MGAWGVGHFDNDDAGDWVWELEDANSFAPVETAFAAVESSEDYLEAPDACIGLAAAETVAASHGKPASDLPDPVTQVLGRLAPATPELLARARTVVETIFLASELRELWEETDDFEKWEAKVENLLQRLQ